MRLALTMDLRAAERRKAKADADRAVHFYPAPDGQAVLHATGPAELIATVRASLEATLTTTWTTRHGWHFTRHPRPS